MSFLAIRPVETVSITQSFSEDSLNNSENFALIFTWATVGLLSLAGFLGAAAPNVREQSEPSCLPSVGFWSVVLKESFSVSVCLHFSFSWLSSWLSAGSTTVGRLEGSFGSFGSTARPVTRLGAPICVPTVCQISDCLSTTADLSAGCGAPSVGCAVGCAVGFGVGCQ